MRKAICSSRTACAARRGGSRRGVLLLIVLSLLAMFALIGLTFVILTNHARRSAETAGRAEQYVKGPEDKAEMALMQCVRGTNNPASVLRNHSLLEDLYGYDPTVPFFTVNGVANATTGGQLVNVTITPGLTATLGNRLSVVGRVLTFTTGLARGKSTRVVGCIDDTTIQIVGVPDVAVNDQFVLNGLPFSGTGFGYNPTAGITPPDEPLLGALDVSGLPYALLPNPVSFVPQGSYLDPSGPGGANEDYDAADYQNMLLALQDPTSNTTPIPSLHRPALVYYWFSNLPTLLTGFQWPTNAGTDDLKLQAFLTPYAKNPDDTWKWQWNDINVHPAQVAALKRRIILRPSQDDHPNFTGSNPLSPYVVGFLADGSPALHWDVDNDGDGVPDSIWVDAGLPVQSTKEGVLYKPLVAILCIDLDGRLNLNAHGNLSQASAGFQTPTTLPAAIAAGGLSVLPDPSLVLRGQGVGPAEVSLNALFANVPNDPPHLQYQNLLYGHGYADPTGPQTPGRHGEVVDPSLGTPAVGRPTDRSLFANKMFDLPNGYAIGSPTTAFLSYGTPMDLTGSIAIGLDLRGQPLYWQYNASTCTTTNNPYQMNLSTGSGAPFTVNELEGLLRWYDIDAGTLPSRLPALAPLLRDRSREVTTESWSVPCPAVALPPELRADPAAFAALNNGRAGHVVDLLRARLFKENTSLDPTNPAHVQTVETMMTSLLSPDLVLGLRFDLNRFFGNGRDSLENLANQNAVVDEPGELDRVYPQVLVPGGPVIDLPNTLDPDNDGTPGSASYARERQDYARQLYVMMLMLMNYEVASPGTPTQAEQDTARMVAQWAINIVDFRDRDSIMTPFEYDIDPFRDDLNNDDNPWDVDGVIGTPSSPSPDDTAANRGLVWGCERPELLITETLAFHDRRTEDLPNDDGVGKTTKHLPKSEADPDFDQRLRPQGSLFIELHNPWTDNEPKTGEFYVNRQTNTELSGVLLNQRTPGANGHPVWRLVITTRADVALDPDDPDTTKRPDIERSVYFMDVSGITGFTPTGDGKQYYPSVATNGIVNPGQYAVIGPAATTYLGSRSDGDLSKTRRITLGTTSPTIGVFRNRDDMADTNDFPGAGQVQQAPVTVVVDAPRRLNVSEPVDGYESVDGGATFDGTQYNPPLDKPLDTLSADADVLMRTDTVEAFRVVHLQRLANPLLPYDADTNPYLTIDSSPISITAFNGESATDDPGASGTVKFHSRQRGDSGTTGPDFNLWKVVEYATLIDNWNYDHPATKIAGHHFDYYLKHTLGYLNEPFHATQAIETDPTNFVVGWSSSDTNVPAAYYGSPKTQPFPWLTWLNRPFVSAGELALVPKRRSSQMLANFSIADAASDPYKNSDQPFGHLINFCYDDTSAHAVDATPNWKLHRLLEFVGVPSRFVGTELQGSPSHFSGGAHSFHPPFNRISNYREPGKVNLNTITSQRVWNGLLGGFTSPIFSDFVESRRSLTTGTGWDLDPTLPTRFANPFRSFTGKYLVPLPALQTQIGEEVNATMLRPVTATSSAPLFDFTSAQPVNDTDRNPAFRNQLLARLDNVATNRSNVYAIWITVGYFEAEPWREDPVGSGTDAYGRTQPQFLAIHPDGYQLGRELGSDTGEATRHRAFYIIDRSIPVGFQRGEDLNSRDTILLRRNIE